MAAFHCPECGALDHVLADGYGIGDRLLEGVQFVIRRDAEGVLTAATDVDSKSYMAQLNEPMWLARILEYAREADFLTCPICGEESVDPAVD